MVSAALVEEKLRVALECHVLQVEDVSGGCGSSFNVLCVSPQFQGKSLLQRHRLVNTLFAEELRTQIHAFTLKTYTDEEYAKSLGSSQ
mmetsp:Transcript_9260/g.17694  ORF Transcript_9260/g.17694 Transcript_9260/m.17694 type:complete len:88 (-) Transcript_9260:1850-2113(-)